MKTSTHSTLILAIYAGLAHFSQPVSAAKANACPPLSAQQKKLVCACVKTKCTPKAPTDKPAPFAPQCDSCTTLLPKCVAERIAAHQSHGGGVREGISNVAWCQGD